MVLLNCDSLMPFYGIMYAWNLKLTEIMNFFRFLHPIGHLMQWYPPLPKSSHMTLLKWHRHQLVTKNVQHVTVMSSGRPTNSSYSIFSVGTSVSKPFLHSPISCSEKNANLH